MNSIELTSPPSMVLISVDVTKIKHIFETPEGTFIELNIPDSEKIKVIETAKQIIDKIKQII